MKKIESLQWEPAWTSHLGCLKGCAQFLGGDISTAWLYGATGHAFIINMHNEVCPSGPTAWRKEHFLSLIQNAGIVTDAIVGFKKMANFHQKQQEVWDRTRKAIDEEVPVIAWEAGIPEFYIVNGYDNAGYYTSGPKPKFSEAPEPFPWNKLGDSGIGVLEVYFVGLGKPPDDLSVLKDALKFADDFKSSPAVWVFQDYASGLSAYDRWIRALQNKKAHPWGMAYNTAVWHECRHYAKEFMNEAVERIGGIYSQLLKEAAEYYGEIEDNLKKLMELFPFPPEESHVTEDDRIREGAGLLAKAKDAEQSALMNIGNILKKIE